MSWNYSVEDCCSIEKRTVEVSSLARGTPKKLISLSNIVTHTRFHIMDHSGFVMPDNHNIHHMDMQSSANTNHSHGPQAHDHEGCGMSMSFHTGYNEVILFNEWHTTTTASLIGSMLGIILMATLYEGLKYYREYLFWKTYNTLQYKSVKIPGDKAASSGTEEGRIVHMVGEVIHKEPPSMWSWMHCYQTFLHMVQMILSYFIMLIFMTYNVWLCLAVVIGAAIGYFLFGWKKSVVVDVTEHCH